MEEALTHYRALVSEIRLRIRDHNARYYHNPHPGRQPTNELNDLKAALKAAERKLEEMSRGMNRGKKKRNQRHGKRRRARKWNP